MSHPDVTPLSLSQLFDGHATYRIPIYQRNYAWGSQEIGQLIEDIVNLPEGSGSYHLGTLVVNEWRDGGRLYYDTIDGQQRLTTLSLLLAYLRRENQQAADLAWFRSIPVSFECRRGSAPLLEAIFSGSEKRDDDPAQATIIQGYRYVKRAIRSLSDGDRRSFLQRLLERVRIVRVKVPEHTDLNHYFEIMNSRGEQLELHEILKARMMERLRDPRESATFQRIWDACSNMPDYLQRGFNTTERDALFGTGERDSLRCGSFSEVCEALFPEDLQTNGSEAAEAAKAAEEQLLSLEDILRGKEVKAEKIRQTDQGEDPARYFTSVINFPNFLLQVLRVMTGKDVSLDDKQLLNAFNDEILKRDNAADLIRSFLFYLLRSKYLLDRYVLKREYNDDGNRWSLKRFKAYGSGSLDYVNTFSGEDSQRLVLLLLAGFHTSVTSQTSKHWLNAVLRHLLGTPEESITGESYLAALEGIARDFVFGQYLDPAGGRGYHSLVYGQRPVFDPERFAGAEVDELLQYRQLRHIFVFNYLDYLLLKRYAADLGGLKPNWQFTFRTSVEHHHPQTPLDGDVPLSVEEGLHRFGNLSLVSDSRNSQLGNRRADDKHSVYSRGEADSVKQFLMLHRISLKGARWSAWGPASIREHGDEMKELLLSSLNAGPSAADVDALAVS